MWKTSIKEIRFFWDCRHWRKQGGLGIEGIFSFIHVQITCSTLQRSSVPPACCFHFLSWLKCFLILYAAKYHKGLGWCMYDVKFQQKAAANKSLKLSTTDSQLWLKTRTSWIYAHKSNRSWCGKDHPAIKCPLSWEQKIPLHKNGKVLLRAPTTE